MDTIVDLTMSYTSQIKGFSKEISKTIEIDGWNASTLTFYSHCGTHMDAPTHFDVRNQSIDQIPVSDFIGRAWVIDIRHIGARGIINSTEIPGDIKRKFTAGDSLILWSNWSKQTNYLVYRNELPRISEEFALWCVEKKVKMIGVEPPSVADVNNIKEVTKIHQILLQSVIIIEGLTSIDQLQSNCVELVALPLKIFEGDGSPARVIAIEKYK